ncbi:MAG: Rv2175c family DNA-binding protein [Micrococcaceae bacterium]
MSDENNKKLDELVDSWLTIGAVSEELGTTVPRVKSLVDRRTLIGVKRGDPEIFSIPALFIKDGKPLDNLKGTLNLLHDVGYSDAEAIAWLFTEEDSLDHQKPIDVLVDGTFKTQVRRVIQALAW